MINSDEVCVMIALHPGWWKKILSGEKDIEVRKIMPIIIVPFKVVVYESIGPDEDGRKMVVGEFVCNQLEKVWYYGNDRDASGKSIPYYISSEEVKRTGLTYDELCAYGNHRHLAFWHVSNPVEYTTPKSLKDFRVVGNGEDCPVPQGIVYVCLKGDS